MKTTPNRPAPSASIARTEGVPSALRRLSFTVLVVLTLLGQMDRASAQGTVPERMSYQGFMEDAGGVPLGQSAPVNLPVVFRIFPVATGGSSSWTESQNVTFDKGNYSVLLGQGAAVGAEPKGNLSELVKTNAGNQLFVETTVTINGTPTRISPRLRLVAAPYSLLATRALTAGTADVAERATTADSAAALTGTVNATQVAGTLAGNQLAANAVGTATIANSAVTTPKIADGNVTTAKIADGNVTTVKIATGNVTDDKILSLSATKLTGTVPAARLPGTVARTDVANTFTANQTMGNLTVNGTLNLGANPAVAAGESLRIVRGVIKLTTDGTFTPYPFGAAGTTNAFRVERNATTGFFKITFQPGFAGEPAVTVCPINDTSFGGDIVDAYAQIKSLSPSTVDINFLQPNAGGGRRLPFSFIAVGPR